MTEPAPAPPAAPPMSQRSAIVRLLLIAGVFAGLMWFCFADTSKPADDLKREAASACEGFVMQRLKLPSTADFGGYATRSVTGSGKQWTVAAFVVSENSFGGKVQTHYVCTVTQMVDGEWQLTALSGL